MHTKGPWEIHTYKDKRIEILHPLINTKDDEYRGTIGGYMVIVGKKNCEKGYILNKDNAALISSAPDMLEALKNAVIDAEQTLTKEERIKRAEYYKAIITKAEGGEG